MVYRRYDGKRLQPGDPNWNKGTWYMWQRIGSGKAVHKALKGVSTEAEALEVEKSIMRKVAQYAEGVIAERLAKRANAAAAIVKPRSLYVLESGGYFKIGHTGDLRKRISSITKTIIPFDVRIVFAIQTARAIELEQSFHGMFADCRVRGEWFDLTSAQLQQLMKNAVESLTAPV